MIIIKLSGGLGNQMFQYALGKHLANKHQTELILDASIFSTQTLRNYELNVFSITEKHITAGQIRKYVSSQSSGALKNIIEKIQNRISGYKMIIEKHFHFDPEILNSPKNSYLTGYWQSEKYFETSEMLIRKSFVFREPQNEKNRAILEAISSSNSVSIHIRRGDYVSNSTTNSVHGTCDVAYYNDAVSRISKFVKDPVFYIFSDDIAWARENIRISDEHYYVEGNEGTQHYEDMRLMSNCRHNIIANSSFSWWAAWLNNNAAKIVIAPRKWFADNNRNTKDLLPEKWIKL